MNTIIFCENLFGKLKPELVKKLEAVINDPTPENWDNAYSLIVGGKHSFGTLWQAVLVVDPTYLKKTKPVEIGKTLKPEDKWPSVPTSHTIKKALKWVAEKNIKKLSN